MSLHKSMQASYNLYNKTRPSASKSSVARAKKLLEECGGAAQLQSMLHPSFSVETAKEHGYQPGGFSDCGFWLVNRVPPPPEIARVPYDQG